ncbi:macro domain-containing protein [Planctomycetota bacterium]
MALKRSDKLSIVHTDLFELDVDAIVNPINTDLILGAGIAGELRKRGGMDIQEECLEIGSIPIGQAVNTSGGNLKVPHVIHAATMKIGGVTTEANLISSIESVSRRIRELNIARVAFPPMGIGVGRFPVRRSAEVMIETIYGAVLRRRCIEQVILVLPDEDMCTLFEETHARLTGESGDAADINDQQVKDNA